MKTTDFIAEGIGEDADAMHKDHEVQLARQDCYTAAKNAIELHKLLANISETEGLEGWISEKLTLAADYLNTVKEHFDYQQRAANHFAMPEFTFESAEAQFKQSIANDSNDNMFSNDRVTDQDKLDNEVWRKVEDVVGQIYPDGDPIDWLIPWFKQKGIQTYKVGEILNRAAKKNGYSDLYAYWDSMGDDRGYGDEQGVAEGDNYVTTWAVRVVAHNNQFDTLSKTIKVKTNDYHSIGSIVREKLGKKGYTVTHIGHPVALDNVAEGTWLDDNRAKKAAEKAAASADANEYRQYGITARKAGGDDAYSWAVFINGRMMVNGLSSREVPYYKKEALKKAKQTRGVVEGQLNELAPDNEGGAGDDEYYEDLLFTLAYAYWSGTNSAHAEKILRELGWKPEYGDDYVAIVLYKDDDSDHRQYTIDEFEEFQDGHDNVAEGNDEFAPSKRAATRVATSGWRRGGERTGSLKGYITTTFAHIQSVLGKPVYGPTNEPYDKVSCEWVITFKDGTNATIYDYKTGRTPMGEYAWHIGGGRNALEYVSYLLGIDADVRESKQQVSEMTAGGTGAGGFATGPTAGGTFKKTTGVPKKVKNTLRRVTPKIGTGVYK